MARVFVDNTGKAYTAGSPAANDSELLVPTTELQAVVSGSHVQLETVHLQAVSTRKSNNGNK